MEVRISVRKLVVENDVKKCAVNSQIITAVIVDETELPEPV